MAEAFVYFCVQGGASALAMAPARQVKDAQTCRDTPRNSDSSLYLAAKVDTVVILNEIDPSAVIDCRSLYLTQPSRHLGKLLRVH